MVFLITLRGDPGNHSNIMHGIVTAVGVFLCMFPAMGFAAAAFGKKFRIYSIVTMILFVVCGILAGLQQPQYAANLPTPFLGAWERINIYGYMLWIIILALLLVGEGRLQAGGEND